MPTGLLLLDKPHGLSSNAALQRVRRAYGAHKAGHAGSLDPLATGMLPVCLDEATKVAGDLIAGRKAYVFEVSLGSRTATGDAEGEVVEERPVPAVGDAPLAQVLAEFLGTRRQTPPMYSALKRDGQPLYRLARAGVEVERTPRDIHIDALDLLARTPARLTLRTVCSKGTYVRTLAEEIANALGTCGHVASLRREWVEPFAGEPMVTLDAVLAGAAAGALPPLMPPDRALLHLPAVACSAEAAARLRKGQQAKASQGQGRCRLYDEQSRFFGLGEWTPEGLVQPRRLLAGQHDS